MYKSVNSNLVSRLVLINVAVFIFQNILSSEQLLEFHSYFALVPQQVLNGKLWQIFTYSFLHDNIFHLLFNMYALYIFGKPVENYWGSARFMVFYLFVSIGAGLTIFVINGFVYGDVMTKIPTIGASGAVFGILLAFGLTFPNIPVYLMGIIGMPAKYMVILYGVIEIVLELQGHSNISHVGHLGGLVFGFIFLKAMKHSKIEKRTTKFFSDLKKDYDKKIESIRNGSPEKDDSIEFLKQLFTKLKDSNYEMTDDEWQKFKYIEIMFDDSTDTGDGSEVSYINQINEMLNR